MVKNKQYILDFYKKSKGEYIKEEIKISDNTLIRLYITYKNIKAKSNIKLDNIIKYLLPANKKAALKELMEGITVEGVRYIPLITSPAMMKKEDKNGKCEYLFINEEDKEFIDLYQKLISLNKIDVLKNKDKLVINKDIIARTGLALSGSYKINYNPQVVILPSDSYTYINNYVTINKDGKLENLDNKVGKHVFADGCGFMSERMAEIIARDLNVDYKVDFAIIRAYNGLATKGLVIRADWNKFFDENYIRTEKIFEKRYDGYYTKDLFGKMVNVSNADIILNDNMCKWAKLWKNEKFEDINEAINKELNKTCYRKYKDILSSLYVTKINKKEIETHTKISYQVLGNLALLPSEVKEICADSVNYLNRVKNGEEDSVRLYFKDLARDGEDEISASTKIHNLIQAKPSVIKTKMARKVISSSILKSAHLIAGGKPYIKGGYKYSFIDPVCYLKWIMTRDIESSRSLKEREYHVNNNAGKRILTRNPLAVFSEVHRIELKENKEIKKYFGDLTEELIFFNQADDTAFISSGEDFDGDCNGVWENDILYNAVIEPKDGRHFFNPNDGASKEVKYSLENMYKCVLKASGNLIGSIANTTTKISNKASILGYIKKKENKIYDYLELREEWLNLKENIGLLNKLNKQKDILKNWQESLEIGQVESEEEAEEQISIWKNKIDATKLEIKTKFNTCLEEQIKENKLIDIETMKDEEVRYILINQFYKLREDMYYALYQSQRAIDAPKTCVFPTKEDLERLEIYSKTKYPTFIYHAKFTKNYEALDRIDKKDTNFYRTALNINAKELNKNLIVEINKLKDKKHNDNALILYNLINVDIKECLECSDDLLEIYNEYKEYRKDIYNRQLQEVEKKKEYNNLDLKIIEKVEDLEFIYSSKEIIKSAINNKLSTTFIIKFLWNSIDYIIRNKELDITAYKVDVNGEIDWLFKNYTKVEAKLKDNQLQTKLKNDLIKKTTFKFNIGGLEFKDIIEGEILNVVKSTYFNRRQNKDIEHALIYAGNKKVGYVYQDNMFLKDGRSILDFNEIVVKEVILQNNKNYLTIISEL